MKLFWKLMILTALVGMVPLLVGGVLLIGINRDALETNIRERRVEAARFSGHLID